MRIKGNYDNTGPKRVFEVVDEVSVIVGDTRYALERLRFEDGSEVIRAPYWTIEGRVRWGAKTLRVGFGQYSPMTPPNVFFALVEQAIAKGWNLVISHRENAIEPRLDDSVIPGPTA